MDGTPPVGVMDTPASGPILPLLDQQDVLDPATVSKPSRARGRQASVSSIPSKPQSTSNRNKDGGGRRTAPRLPTAAVRILETWLVEHRDTPYVSTHEQDQLKARTGLRRSQIKTWFANARKRGRVESLLRPSTGLPFVLSPSPNEPQPPLFHKGEQPGGRRSPTGPSHFDTVVFPQLSGLDPFVRWLLLGPEHEPATVQAIHEAIKEKDIQQDKAAFPASPWPAPPASAPDYNTAHNKDNVQFTNPNTGLPFGQVTSRVVKRTRSQRSWPSSLDIRSYAANKFSVASDEWKPSIHAGIRKAASVMDGGGAKSVDYVAPSKPARRHRRSEMLFRGSSVRGSRRTLSLGGERGPPLPDDVNNNNNRRFQCTFCTDAFVKRHDWQRHEKSQHLALEWWTCCPNDGLAATHVDPLTSKVTCVFCGVGDPDRAHLDEQHGLAACAARSEVERTFYRKDHLRQHLRLMHADSTFTPAMEAWKTELVEVKSRCGFCVGVEFDTWPTRVSHLAAHFRAGVTMDKWRGDWGLEEGVKENLERATLPAERVKNASAHAAEAVVSPRAALSSAHFTAGSIDVSWANLDSPMMDIPSSSFPFGSSFDYTPLAPASVMSDNTAGVPWDLSLLDFDTLTTVGGIGSRHASRLDTLDDYSFSTAASALDFPRHEALRDTCLQQQYLTQPYHDLRLQQPQSLSLHDPILPLDTPPIFEDINDLTVFPPQTLDGYDGPASALLDYTSLPLVDSDFAQQQQQPQSLFNTETFLGVPAYDTTFDPGGVNDMGSPEHAGTAGGGAVGAKGGGDQGLDVTQQAQDALTAFLQQHFEDRELPNYPKRYM